jgi:hypothetical protein
MKNYYTETENAYDNEDILSELCGGLPTSRFEDDFGIDDSWLESFIEDYNIGG